MKLITGSLVFLLSLSAFGQSDQVLKIAGYSGDKMDIVLFPFGMQQKVDVGAIDKKGIFALNFADFDISKYENTDMYFDSFGGVFNAFCDEEEVEDGSIDDKKFMKSGYLYLHNGARWTGAIIAATSPELSDYLQDEGMKDAVTGSYLYWVYSSEAVKYKSVCKASVWTANGNIDEVKTYDIDIQPGWNMIQVEITEINPITDYPAKPVAQSFSTITSYPEDMKWFSKKF